MTFRLVLAAAALTLGACSQSDDPTPPEATTSSPQGQVERTQPAPETVAAPTPMTPALQVQDGPEGSRVSLTRAQVTGDVLTVQLRYEKSGDSLGARFAVEEVSVIDDATAQRYGVLRDQAQRWQASPLQSPTSDYTLFSARPGDPAVVWFKFPAPPATSQTVSINIPGVGPFDGVTVQR